MAIERQVYPAGSGTPAAQSWVDGGPALQRWPTIQPPLANV